MAELRRLTDRQIRSYVNQGVAKLYADGGGLYLRVTGQGAASWVFRTQVNGKIIQKGIGPLKNCGVADARRLAERMHEAIGSGAAPETVRQPKHDPATLTFKAVAEHYVGTLRTKLRNGKPRNGKAIDQWTSTLTKWAYPKIGSKRPSEVTYRDVEAVLTQAGLAKLAETQKRVRLRIKVVLDEAAKAEGEPHRYNPALSYKLETRRPDSIKHHAAAPWQEVPTLMAGLRERDSVSAALLRFSILTAARSGEARGALWAEIDLEGATWTIPGTRMKGGRQHRVPLCPEAVAILEAMKPRKHPTNDRVFPGDKGGLISDVAVNKTLHAIMPNVTAHGMRSSFRQWVADATSYSPEAAELALAHSPKDKVQAAYQRSDMFEVRKLMMAAWGKYCSGSNNVVQLAASA